MRRCIFDIRVLTDEGFTIHRRVVFSRDLVRDKGQTMNYPSVKTLSTIAPDIDAAKTVRGLITGAIDPETIPETAQWARECFNRPRRHDLIMHACDIVLENFGVEAFQTRRGWCEYSNAGDTYTGTLVYFQGRYRVCCWGDIAERYAPREY